MPRRQPDPSALELTCGVLTIAALLSTLWVLAAVLN
jgi:hypothetical protein